MMRVYPIFFSIILLLFGCVGDSPVFEKNITIEKSGWSYDKPVSFTVPISVPSDTFDMFLNVRYNQQYSWRNLWVNVNTRFPDGNSTDARINLKLESAKGESFGKCTGDICFVRIPVQYQAIFPDSGSYVFTIEQEMRINPIKNIEQIGLRIEKSPQDKT